MDSTEATQGDAIEQRGPMSGPPSPETPTAPPETADIAAGGGAERAPEARPHDGIPPRRRRRRRRRGPPPASSGVAAGEPQPGEASAVPAASGEAGAEAEPAAGAEAGTAAEGAPVRPILRLRSRRRRRRPHGLLPGPSEPARPADGGAAPGSEAGDSDAAKGVAAVAPGIRSFHAPRRRRRHPPLVGAAAAEQSPAGAGEAASSATEMPAGAPDNRPPRPRRRRRPRTGAPGSPAAATGERHAGDAAGASGRSGAPRGPRDRSPGARAPGDGGSGQRQETRRDTRRDAGPRDGRRDRRDGPPGRGRRDAPRQIERKLYSVDSVVDRGFEDVEEEAGTRRVHWTIVKRTTADQVSRKAISALYVLQRDGVDSEFPSLGAARNAVNKTIVHPEKLTRSKAEYAAEKK